MFWFLPSFLTPTFFFLGLAAISLPVLFHFFRRTPKGSLYFSTLMFLQSSPPRLTRRSRVDNWLLLILRGIILLLIALGFGRIFFRQTDFLNISNLTARQVAILVDTSASMKRGNLWDQAQSEVKKVVDSLGPNDKVALFTFDNELKTIVGFSRDQPVQLSGKKDLILSSLAGVSPVWGPTQLATALINVSEQLEGVSDNDFSDEIAESQIVLISDFQTGSKRRALQSFEWPKNISVELRTLRLPSSNNATLSLIQNQGQASPADQLRVKVSNIEGATSTQFDLKWIAKGEISEQLAATAVVPAGQSRIVTLARPDAKFAGIRLAGDDFEFDNSFFVAYPDPIPERILFLGERDDTRNQLLFYLKKACSSLIGKRMVFLDERSFSADLLPTAVFVVGPVEVDQMRLIREFADNGGLVCFVVTDLKMEAALEEFFQQEVSLSEAETEDFALLGDIDFGNRLFEKFADPNYSNFASIRFWKHRQVIIPGIKPIARFDNGDLAVGGFPTGPGIAYVFAAGWHPADSQFALSTKFVGVMMSLILKSISPENLNYELGQPIDYARLMGDQDLEITLPNGKEIQLSGGKNPELIPEIDEPGLYRFESANGSKMVAFNLPASESQTDPLDTALLTQSGIALGTMDSATEKVEIERQRRDRELESRQKLWRWMLILALAALFLETVLSGYFTQKQSQVDLAKQET